MNPNNWHTLSMISVCIGTCYTESRGYCEGNSKTTAETYIKIPFIKNSWHRTVTHAKFGQVTVTLRYNDRCWHFLCEHFSIAFPTKICTRLSGILHRHSFAFKDFTSVTQYTINVERDFLSYMLMNLISNNHK